MPLKKMIKVVVDLIFVSVMSIHKGSQLPKRCS